MQLGSHDFEDALTSSSLHRAERLSRLKRVSFTSLRRNAQQSEPIYGMRQSVRFPLAYGPTIELTSVQFRESFPKLPHLGADFVPFNAHIGRVAVL